MATPIIFPDDRKLLQTWNLVTGQTYADAVLIHPPRGKHEGQKIMVLKGSKVRGGETKSCPRYAKDLRRRLFSLGEVEHYYEDWRLTADIVFDCPSAAACVVLGKSSNGWDYWRLKDDCGPSLDEVEEGRQRILRAYYERPQDSVDIPSDNSRRQH